MYQITNKLDGRLYVGVHGTNDLDDGYMGSGQWLRAAIVKHGLENFEKKILETFETVEEMFEREAEVVTSEFIKQSETYNLMPGGRRWENQGTDWANARRTWLLENDLEFRERYSKALSEGAKPITEEHRRKLINGARAKQAGAAFNPQLRAEMNRRSQLPEAIDKKKRVLADRKHQQGEKNSHFGKIWITDGINSRSIPKDEPVPDGWKKGRVIKKR